MVTRQSSALRIKFYIALQLQAVFAGLIFIPILYLLVLISFIPRQIARISAAIFRKDLAGIYSEKGVTFAVENPSVRPKTIIVNLFFCDRPVPVDILREQFQLRVIDYCDKNGHVPFVKLRQFYVQFMGFFFWKWDDKFVVSNHVRAYDLIDESVALPSVCTEKDLEKVTGDLMSRPFLEDRSLWELLVVPNFRTKEGKDGSVMILRIHHSLADGHSIVSIFSRLFNQDLKIPPARFSHKMLCIRALRLVQVALKLPWDAARIMFHTADKPNQWNLEDRKLSRTYFTYFCGTLPVSWFKLIAKKYGCSYNAAIYSVAAGVIVRMMKEAGHEVPESLSVYYPVPLPGHPGSLVNHMTMDTFTFNTKSVDASERLMQVARKVRRANVFVTRPIALDWIVRPFSYLPVCAIRLLLGGKSLQTLAMSSFAGSSVEMDVFGQAKVIDMIAITGRPQGQQGGALVAMNSYCGTQRITLAIDRTILSDERIPFKFIEHVRAELNALLDPQDLA